MFGMLFRDINLDAALESGQFVPYFQPLVGLRSGSLEGFEVLARWNHPRAGLVMPNEFIGRAEREGWIGELTRELLRAAFLRMSQHQGRLMLAVNISPVQLRDVSLEKQLRATADQTGFSLERLMVEITESALTANLELALLICAGVEVDGLPAGAGRLRKRLLKTYDNNHGASIRRAEGGPQLCGVDDGTAREPEDRRRGAWPGKESSD